jgi:hypothetical protein
MFTRSIKITEDTYGRTLPNVVTVTAFGSRAECIAVMVRTTTTTNRDHVTVAVDYNRRADGSPYWRAVSDNLNDYDVVEVIEVTDLLGWMAQQIRSLNEIAMRFHINNLLDERKHIRFRNKLRLIEGLKPFYDIKQLIEFWEKVNKLV